MIQRRYYEEKKENIFPFRKREFSIKKSQQKKKHKKRLMMEIIPICIELTKNVSEKSLKSIY